MLAANRWHAFPGGLYLWCLFKFQHVFELNALSKSRTWRWSGLGHLLFDHLISAVLQCFFCVFIIDSNDRGQLDGKELLNEEPDWRPAKNLRQAHAKRGLLEECDGNLGMRCMEGWSVRIILHPITRPKLFLRNQIPWKLAQVVWHFRDLSWRSCVLKCAFHPFFGMYAMRATIQVTRKHYRFLIHLFVCIFYFLVCVFLYVFLFVFGLWVWVCLSSCLLDSFALIHSDLD